MKIEYAEDATVFTEGASDLNGLLKQRLRWKRGRLEAFFKYKKFFFNIRKRYNRRLTCFVLPLAILAEAQLLFEIIFLIIIYSYTISSHNYALLISPILFIGSSILIVNLNSNQRRNPLSGFYSIIGWLLFYVITFVEYNSLIKCIIASGKKQQVKWQRWERKGVFN
jgi:cellulose synthase/poly-beta-1,6-N-acetylglucosamine synthase-like glycosyltransferase